MLLLWLLLPLAALSGWWVAGKAAGRRHRSSPINPKYLQGLNYLLNEQSDRAVEVFIDMLKVDSETVETHLALASLFRRRGEVERAIRLHQNLIARPSLPDSQRAQAELGLAQDYLYAGLLDRAETLFGKLKEQPETRVESLRNLLQLYQQEKAWAAAIDTCKQLAAASGQPRNELLAQMNCERAEAALLAGEYRGAQRHVKQAREFDRDCARAIILAGRIDMARGKPAAAYRSFEYVIRHHGAYLYLIWDEMQDCMQQLDRAAEVTKLLQETLERDSSPAVVCALFDMQRSALGLSVAVEFLVEQLDRHPSELVLQKIVQVAHETEVSLPKATLGTILRLAGRILEQSTLYHCRQCGFQADSHYWQCPSCKQWDTLRVSEELTPA